MPAWNIRRRAEGEEYSRSHVAGGCKGGASIKSYHGMWKEEGSRVHIPWTRFGTSANDGLLMLTQEYSLWVPFGGGGGGCLFCSFESLSLPSFLFRSLPVLCRTLSDKVGRTKNTVRKISQLQWLIGKMTV